MRIKLVTAVIASTLLLGASLGQAQQDAVAANLAFSTDYIFRGISRTEGKPAVQGEFSYLAESGYYGSLWGSNIAYAGSIELEASAGLRRALTEVVDYDIGLSYFNYPGSSSTDTVELRAALEYAGIRGGVAHTNDYFGTGARSHYFSLGYERALIENLYLGLNLGFSEASDDIFGDRDSYRDLGVRLSASAVGLNVALSWTSTNLSRRHCGFSSDCSSNFALSISKDF